MFIFGLNELGEYVHIADAPRGNAGKLSCVYCQAKLTAKKGPIIAHHFAHQKEQDTACRGMSDTFQKIVFGFDYYDFTLSSTQKKGLHCLINACLERKEGYLLKEFYWKDRTSAKYLLYNGGISKNRASDKLVDSLVEEGFFTVQTEPNPNYTPNTYSRIATGYMANLITLRPTPKALAFCLKLPLFQFIRVLQAWWTQLEQALTDPLELDLLRRHRQRIRLNTLYFLTIQSSQPVLRDPADLTKTSLDQLINKGERTLIKIGITSRPIQERVAEIRGFLAKHWSADPIIQVRHNWDGGAALAELYFKKKYHSQLYSIHTGTEYFVFSDEQLQALKPDFHQLTLKTSSHKEKIKRALAARKGQPDRGGRSQETQAAFLAKPKNKVIQELLAQSLSLRQIAQQTGASINTVRKINDLLKQDAS